MSDFQRKADYHLLMFYSLTKSLLFNLPAEVAHNLALTTAKLAPSLGKLTGISPDPRLSVQVGSLKWATPVGLAAGLDKNAEALDFFSNQGFGALEAGTITLKEQSGNPKPRMFRYPEEKSLRNSMGFPNEGLDVIAPRLKKFHKSIPLGANIGKNKETSAEESINELKILCTTLAPFVDYLAINVSSPNTPGLRALQEKVYLAELFTELNKVRQNKDLFLKLSPDLENDKLSEIAQLAADYKLSGLIATNTTIMPERGIGGISGRLLKSRSSEVRKFLLQENLPIEIIGVGGFESSKDFFDFWLHGGKVAQVYTSYIYQGPDLLKGLAADFFTFLKLAEINSLQDFFDLPLSKRQVILTKFYPA